MRWWPDQKDVPCNHRVFIRRLATPLISVCSSRVPSQITDAWAVSICPDGPSVHVQLMQSGRVLRLHGNSIKTPDQRTRNGMQSVIGPTSYIVSLSATKRYASLCELCKIVLKVSTGKGESQVSILKSSTQDLMGAMEGRHSISLPLGRMQCVSKQGNKRIFLHVISRRRETTAEVL